MKVCRFSKLGDGGFGCLPVAGLGPAGGSSWSPSRKAITFLRRNLGKPFLPPVVSETDLSRPDLASLATVSLEHRRI